MIPMEKIQVFVDRLVAEFEPERVILFGSYAWGTATEDSDVDLLVVVPDSFEDESRYRLVRTRLKPGFPLDILFRNASTVRERIELGDFFMSDVVTKGKVLYDAEYARVD